MEAQLRYRKELNSSIFPTVHKAPRKNRISPQESFTESESEAPSDSKKPPRVDFIQRNIDHAAHSKSRQKVAPEPSRKQLIVDAVHRPGQIPKASREKLTEPPQPVQPIRCPPGTRLLSEAEKMEAIASLEEQKQELEETLGQASLHVEGQARIKRQREMEDGLRGIERSLDQLNRQFVFVPV
jgi:hypothetical protein